ncbi:MAG TPA: DMT family transporter [Pseudonocardia sp.]
MFGGEVAMLAASLAHHRDHVAAAAGAAVASSGCYAVAAVLQEREASRSAVGGLAMLRVLIRRTAWWGAVLATGAGGGLHILALAVGPLSVVQPISMLTLVWALPLGCALTRRVVPASEWAAAALVVAGLGVTLSVLAHRGSTVRLPLGALLGTSAVCAALVGVLVAVATRLPGRGGPILGAVAAAICSGYAATMWRAAFQAAAPFALATLIGVVAAGAGLALAQLAYHRGGLGAPLATLTLVNPLVAVGLGVALLGEPVVLTPLTATLCLVGISATGGGIWVLARPRTPPAADNPTHLW